MKPRSLLPLLLPLLAVACAGAPSRMAEAPQAADSIADVAEAPAPDLRKDDPASPAEENLAKVPSAAEPSLAEHRHRQDAAAADEAARHGRAGEGESAPLASTPEASHRHHRHEAQKEHGEAHEHPAEEENVLVMTPLEAEAPVEPPPPARVVPREELQRKLEPTRERGDAVIAGRIELIQVHPIPAGPGQLQRTWVAFYPNRGRHRAAPMEEQRIITRQSQFQPQALMITLGTTVRFPNYDRIQHNVFSLSEGNRFDVGLYGPGEGVAHTFLNPGVVYVYCNIHPNMAAFVWVVDTPYHAQIQGDGSFRIEGVPRGGGILEVWNHRAELYRFPVVAPDENVRIALRITKPPVLQHTNKFGRPY
ncbi:MAG: hypothetical protein KatS3mg125_0387 [Lysobacterales bacterium]|nr:MAG: hypothetical protein KatS3mg125_0387 [Xanthomonadales bacterium]